MRSLALFGIIAALALWGVPSIARGEEVAAVAACNQNANFFGIQKASTEGLAAAAAVNACVAKGGSATCCRVIGATNNSPTIETMPSTPPKDCWGLACVPVESKDIHWRQNCISLAISSGFEDNKRVIFAVGYGDKAVQANSQAVMKCVRSGGTQCVARAFLCTK